MSTEPSFCSDCPVHRGIDHLTGAQRRTVVLADLNGRLARGEASTLLLLDLDGFKQVNDTLGHPAGDTLLRMAADRIRRILRNQDVLARLSGDEFAILLPVLDDAAAARLGARIVNLLGRPFMVDGRLAHVGVSVGCATAPRDATEPGELIRMADLALYSAKQSGRGRVAFASPALRDGAVEAQRLENELRAALALEQLRLAYQPQYDLRTGELSGFEALMRWHHPHRGAVGPDIFIPIMERSHLIVDAGAWALHEAAVAARDWAETLRLGSLPRMAVNVSATQFDTGRLVGQVEAALKVSGTDPRHLELEVTESVLLRRGPATVEQLRALQGMGVEIALDDFGTGHSSLSLLQAFAFDRLKIDRSFLGEDARCHAILGSLAQLAQGLRMRTTAEGVETSDQLSRLRGLGCTDVQGFLTGRPVAPGAPIATRLPEAHPTTQERGPHEPAPHRLYQPHVP